MGPSVSDINSHLAFKTKPVSAENGPNKQFTYSALPNLKRAIEKAGADFRSDVSTVPTEDMMQVRKAALPGQRREIFTNIFGLKRQQSP